MKKITRRNFLIASGKTVGTLAAASAFMGCASPEQAENCFPRSAMPVRTDDRLTANYSPIHTITFIFSKYW